MNKIKKAITENFLSIVAAVVVITVVTACYLIVMNKKESQEKEVQAILACECESKTHDKRVTYITECRDHWGMNFTICELQARKLYCCDK